jgi:hypothetical protein
MGDDRMAPAGWRGGGFLAQLPPGAQELVDQEKDRLGRLLCAVLGDQQVSLSDLVLVVLADIEADMGKALAEILMDSDDVRQELRAAQEQHRRPVVLDVAVKDKAVEFMSLVMPEIASYVALRPPFAFVLLVIDKDDNPSITMAVPTTCAVAPGSIH